jgi:hypothetical protein
MTTEPPTPLSGPLTDFAQLRRRVGRAGLAVAAVFLVGLVVDAVAGGLTAEKVLRWVSAALATALVATAVLAALHALRGADSAQKRGERLAGDDVRLRPARRSSR